MKEKTIFQKVLEVGDGDGDLKALEKEIMEKRPELKAGFEEAKKSETGKEEAQRVRDYLVKIFGSSGRFAFLFSS